MSGPPLIQRATALLASAAEGVAERPRPVDPAARARAIELTAAAIARQGQARRTRRNRTFVGVLAAAAAVTALGIGLRARSVAPRETAVLAHAVAGEPVLWRHGVAERLHDEVRLRAGDRVRALPGATAALSMSTGSAVAIESGGDLTLIAVESADVLALSAGAARFHVAKVTAGRRFVVRTDDAEVEVKGTAFRVSIAGGDPSCAVATHTRVEVQEGRVVVRHLGAEVVLDAGAHWPLGCVGPTVGAAPVLPSTLAGPNTPAAPAIDVASPPTSWAPASKATVPSPWAPAPVAPPPLVATNPAVVAPTVAASATAMPKGPGPNVASASDLAGQNDLFAAGLAKKKAGDLAGARAAFDHYLAMHPDGALAESATVEKMRLSSGGAARALAKSYLSRWPKGFARVEAQSLLEH